jgi:hypothetical protein
MMDKTHLEVLRMRLLLLLEGSYPSAQHSDVLFLRITREYGTDTCIRDIVKELHYLTEKGLVALEPIIADRFMTTITAAGRDVISGHSKVAGIADFDRA